MRPGAPAAGPRPTPGRRSWWAGLALAATGLALSPLPFALRPSSIGGGAAAEEAAAAALEEGNRLFRSGRLVEAMTAYAAGWSPGGSAGGGTGAGAVLAYNLGTTAHRLGRYPEAVLWYRRAAAARLDDPWLRDNLDLARARSGAEVMPPSGVLGWLAAYRSLVAGLAVVLVWTALGLRVAALRGGGRRGWPVVAAAALVTWVAAAALGVWGPRPAVLLESCRGADATFAAGTEAWVGRPVAGARPVLGGPVGLTCPERSLGWIE
jgi:hypothetical protein